jgi:transcriptional regulator with XRE-family HTH domain
MADHMPHYTRRYRLRAGLTQKEMAHLLGSRSPATVCQYEARKREPDLRTALAYQVVFGLPVDKLFPGIRRAQHLAQKLSSTRSGASQTHKRQALSAISADWRSLDESAGPNSNHDQP